MNCMIFTLCIYNRYIKAYNNIIDDIVQRCFVGTDDSCKTETVFGEFSVALICNLPEVWQLFNGYHL